MKFGAILFLVVFLPANYECFVIPEEFPSLLSLVYSNIPPIKKGTDSRVGLGFRLGSHADWQILLELGPQTHTDQLGSPNPERAAKRDAVVVSNAQSLVDYFKNIKNYFSPGKKTSEKTSDTPGGKWIDWWRENILTQKQIEKINFNKVPGIDDRISYNSEEQTSVEDINKNLVINHLKQLYKEKPMPI